VPKTSRPNKQTVASQVTAPLLLPQGGEVQGMLGLEAGEAWGVFLIRNRQRPFVILRTWADLPQRRKVLRGDQGGTGFLPLMIFWQIGLLS